MMTATSAVVSAKLLRLLHAHAARIRDDDIEESTRELSIGLLLGALQPVVVESQAAAAATTRLALYGLLEHESDLYVRCPCSMNVAVLKFSHPS